MVQTQNIRVKKRAYAQLSQGNPPSPSPTESNPRRPSLDPSFKQTFGIEYWCKLPENSASKFRSSLISNFWMGLKIVWDKRLEISEDSFQFCPSPIVLELAITCRQ